MKKEFVPYELAVKLKVLGFDEPCFGYFDTDDNQVLKFDVVYENKNLPAPLYQQAFRWFREKYMLSGEIYIFKNIWNFDIEDISNSIQLYTSDIMCYNSYEEAEIECLVKLIEIAKEQNVK